jgi:hypothetical protein
MVAAWRNCDDACLSLDKGPRAHEVSNLGPDNSAVWESWSPDGKIIVFSEFPRPDFRGQLWLMNADGSNQHLLLAENRPALPRCGQASRRMAKLSSFLAPSTMYRTDLHRPS